MPSTVRVVQGAEQAVVVQPPALALLERPQRPVAPIAGAPEVVRKPLERPPQRAALEVSHDRVVHARGTARARQRVAILRPERLVARHYELVDILDER